MSPNPTTAQAIAHELARQHAGLLAGPPVAYAQAVRTADEQHIAETAGTLQGCRMLGFLEHDAQVLAAAWHAQTQRLGQFRTANWPCASIDFGLTPASAPAFAPCPHHLGLYAVLPDADWVGRMARAGVPTVQLRFKSSDPAAIRQEVRAAVRAVHTTGALLFINDHWQLAIEEGAYGVHLGQEDMNDTALQQLRAAGLRLGLSTHGYAEMQRADAVGPSYLALGAVFPTTLKKMQTAPQGAGRLSAYAQLMRHRPLVAIGGIDEARVPLVMQSGVGSIAVVRALTGAENPEWAAKNLAALIERHGAAP